MRKRRGSEIREVDVEIVPFGSQAPEPLPLVAESGPEEAVPAQHPRPVAEPEPDTTAHAQTEGVWTEESPHPGADAAPSLPRPSPIRPAATARRPRGEVCEIAFWRGYVKGSFYARVFDDDGEPVAIAQSPYFRPRGKEEPEATDEALLAYGALRTQLERAGWEYASDGASWFSTVFSRPE